MTYFINRSLTQNSDNFRSDMAEAPVLAFLKNRAYRTGTLICECFLSGMEIFITQKNADKKRKGKSWFTQEYSAAISQRNQYYHPYHRERYSKTRVRFRTAHNHCKIEIAKRSYGQSVQAKFESKRLSFLEFCEISNKILKDAKFQCLLS